jgi:large subunit ribosomal protein L33
VVVWWFGGENQTPPNHPHNLTTPPPFFQFPLHLPQSPLYLEPFPEVRAMAKKAKDARSYVKIISSESDHCYYVQKNRNNTKGRLELRKYDPTIRKHVMYKESK